MAQVSTVTGMVEAEELGTTLIHEHLRNQDEAVHNQWPQAGAAKEEPPHEVAPGEDFDIAVREAKAAVDLGIKTIGEPTAMFLGRDVNFMKRVSEETGLQVVPCTGIYTYDHLPQFFMNRDPDQIAEFFVADIEQGIQGTDIKAAFIKCAADEPGREREHREDPPRGRPGERQDRRADHGPLTARQQHRPAPGRDLRGGGR